jgi:hypothetical protein
MRVGLPSGVDGTLHDHLTPLSDVHKRILELLEVPVANYDGLVT